MNETLKVEGMSCGHCVKSVESSVSKLPGVESVNVDLSKGEVAVVFDSGKTSLTEIQETIKEKGYSVV